MRIYNFLTTFFAASLVLVSCQSKATPIQEISSTYTPTATEYVIPTLEPTLTPTPTMLPTLTPTAAPTSIPLPSNLNLSDVMDLETIDPYYFYIENHGVYRFYKTTFVKSQNQYLDSEKGDTVTGNSTDGWTIYYNYRNLAVFFGPGEKIGNNEVKFTLKAGGKDKSGDIVFTNTKTYVIPEGDLIRVFLVAFFPNSIVVLYDPTHSGFIISSEDAKNFPEKAPEIPRYALGTFMLVTDRQILPVSNYAKYPEWCEEHFEWLGIKPKTMVGYRVDGLIYYIGETTEGEIICPTIREYVE